MAKIFISFFNGITDIKNSNAMPCFYESFLMELKNNGNEVLYYANRQWGQDFFQAPKIFVDKVKAFNPDLIILFNNCCYDLSNEFDCPILIWEVDSPLYYSNIEKIKCNPNRYQFIVVQTSSQKVVKDYFHVQNSNIFYLPFATSIKAQNIPQNTNISFIGTRFNANNSIDNFISTNPSNTEVLEFKNIFNFIEKNPFLTNQEVVKKFNIKSKKILDTLSVKSIVENLSAKNRVQILSAISDLGLQIYGNNNWLNDLQYYPDLVLSFNNKLVYSLEDNQHIYNSSKIGININHVQAQTGFSWRVCDIMASNACLVTEPKSDLRKLFPNIKIPTFNNKHEAYEVCRKILKNDNLRKDIVASCQDAINKNYRFSHLIINLQQIVNIPLKGKGRGYINKLLIDNSNLISNNLFNSAHKKLHQILPKNKIKRNKFVKKILNSPIINRINKKIEKTKLKTRFKLMAYSIFLFVNQIPIINKPLISRSEILDRINNEVKNNTANETSNMAKNLNFKKEYKKNTLTRIKLIFYSNMLFLGQIPLVEKLIMSNSEIVDKVKILINDE